MTAISQYTLDLDCATGVLPEAVELRLLPSHSRLVDTELEASITAEWEAKLGKHPRMFNGAKFRYGCARMVDGGRVCFELALTDYRSMIGTSLSSRLPEIASRGEPRLLANAVGNGAVVETSDRCVMLLLRSPHLLEAPNTYVFPGGHPEPKSVGLEVWREAELEEHARRAAGGEAAAREAAAALERRVRDECFASVRREVVEELGCRDADLCPEGGTPHVRPVGARTRGPVAARTRAGAHGHALVETAALRAP
jgi:8-oxo-dGTP pyrophosphatase MutT (NUDIX family)